MAAAFVQKAISADTVGTTTYTATFGVAATNGNLIVGSVSYNNSNTVSSIKDNNGVNATQIDTVADTVNGQKLTSFYFKNISGAPTAVIAIISASDPNVRVGIQEVSGCDITAPLDVHTMALSSANPATSGGVTTTANGDYVFGCVTSGAGVSEVWTAGSGYTIRNDGSSAVNTISLADENQIQASSGSIAATFGNASSVASIVGIATFKAAAAGGATPLLSRPIAFRPFTLAPFLNRLPPTTSPPPNIPPGVPVRLGAPIRFHPFAKAPWLNRLGAVTPPFNSGNVTALPGFGNLVLTGPPPSLAARIFPGFGSITLNGQAPSLRRAALAGFGSLILTGRAPNLAFVDHPGFGSIILTGFAPTASITSGQTVLPGIGQLILTGLAPSLTEKVFPTNGAILLTGKAPTLKTAVPAGFGAVVLTGKTPFIAALPGPGAMLLTGKPPTVSQSGGGGAVFQTITSMAGFFNPNASAIP